MAVGAMTPNATRANYYHWGSNYGQGLDVVAPGVFIRTTIPNGYIGSFCTNFEGTSAACPHVAAIAGLMLSINPDLTQKEVSYIIESTAQKVGSYNYDSIAPHGRWNYEMGYGLVDAYAAVVAARDIQYNKYIQDTTYANGTTCVEYSKELYAGYAVTDSKPYGDVVIQAGSDVTFKAKNRIELHRGFRVEHGVTFKAVIESPSQQSTSPSYVRRRELLAANNDDRNSDSELAQQRNITLAISPNPVNAILHIHTAEELSQVNIYNLNGQCVLQSAQTDIDVSSLSQGMYILQATTYDGMQHQAKFIKQ